MAILRFKAGFTYVRPGRKHAYEDFLLFLLQYCTSLCPSPPPSIPWWVYIPRVSFPHPTSILSLSKSTSFDFLRLNLCHYPKYRLESLLPRPLPPLLLARLTAYYMLNIPPHLLLPHPPISALQTSVPSSHPHKHTFVSQTSPTICISEILEYIHNSNHDPI